MKPAAVTAEALSALDTFLELPKGGWPKKLKLPKRNVHSKNHECQDEMMERSKLGVFFERFLRRKILDEFVIYFSDYI